MSYYLHIKIDTEGELCTTCKHQFDDGFNVRCELLGKFLVRNQDEQETRLPECLKLEKKFGVHFRPPGAS
jgi:hypothetical protein